MGANHTQYSRCDCNYTCILYYEIRRSQTAMKTGQVEKQLMFLVIAAAIIIVFILILKGYSALVKGGFF